MDFTFYPHDLQYCVLRLQSCGFDYSFVNFTNPSVYMNPEAVESPSFQLVSVRSSVNLVPIRGTLYSECDVTIVLQRKLNYFIYQVGMCTLGSFSELYYSESWNHSEFNFRQIWISWISVATGNPTVIRLFLYCFDCLAWFFIAWTGVFSNCIDDSDLLAGFLDRSWQWFSCQFLLVSLSCSSYSLSLCGYLAKLLPQYCFLSRFHCKCYSCWLWLQWVHQFNPLSHRSHT